LNVRTPCSSIRNILQSAISLSSRIVPPENFSENPTSAQIPQINLPVAIPESYAFVSDQDQFLRRNIPDPYSFAYEFEQIHRCNNCPLFISLSNYLIDRMEKD